MHDFTVIRGRVAAKTFTPQGALDYDLGWQVSAEVRTCADLFDLHALLKELELDRTACIVRGRPRGTHGLTRRYLSRDGVEPGFEACDVSWLCLDLDKVSAPQGFDPLDPLATVDQLLPAALRGAPLIWQYSASQGLPGREGVVSAHLWLLTDRAVSCRSLKRWVRSLGVGDLALYQPVQPHYTARPIFEGVPDPLPRRLYLSTEDRHDHRIALPSSVLTCAEQAAQEEREEAARRARARAQLLTAQERTGRYALAALARACRAILESGTGARHQTLRDEAWALRRFVASGELSEHLWESELRTAAQGTLPPERWSEIDRLLGGARKQP